MGLFLIFGLQEQAGWRLSPPHRSCVAASLLCHPGQAPVPLWAPPIVPLELLQAATSTCLNRSGRRVMGDGRESGTGPWS